MVNKNLVLVILAITLVSFLSYNVLAKEITAKIGNGRMILRLETGESIEKYIRVINSNDIKVTVDLDVTGELKDRVKLDEETFELGPGEEKNAKFTISANKEGTTETNINVKFTPEEGSGVGITSTVIVIASGPGTLDEPETQQNLDESQTDGTSGFSFGQKGATDSGESSQFNLSTDKIMLISTIVLVVVLGVLYFYSNKKRKERLGRKSE